METQISIECIKVYKYLLETEMFEADGTVNEIKKMGKGLEQKALETSKDSKGKRKKQLLNRVAP